MDGSYDWQPPAKAQGAWVHFDKHKTKGDYRCELWKKKFEGQFTSSFRYEILSLQFFVLNLIFVAHYIHFIQDNE